MNLSRRVMLAAAVTSAVLMPFASISAAEAAPKPKKYKNCTALNKVYKHGVGKTGAKDKTSGKAVTTFTRSTKTYKLNTKSDRDKDGIACEKK